MMIALAGIFGLGLMVAAPLVRALRQREALLRAAQDHQRNRVRAANARLAALS